MRIVSFVASFALLGAVAMAAHGQALTEASGRGPRFLVTSTPSVGPRPLDVARTPMLRRRIVLELRNATLAEALAAVSRQAGLHLMYSKDVVPLEQRVTLEVKGITVAAALTELLLDANVDVMFSAAGQAVLVRRRETGEVLSETGTIVGRVTDAKTGDALVGAEVWLEGTKHRTTTGNKGFYRLPDVEVSNYTLSVRRVGYAKQSKPVSVAGSTEATVDVALQAVVTQLDELVTTVTGEQRIRELGHVVGRINADSLVREAPVSSITELLTARVPGLVVSQLQGGVGGEVKLQIRSPNSFLLSNEPIVIVDGIRYGSSSRGGRANPSSTVGVGPFGTEATSRLNDLNPHDIESIEVVKGPSAATLYGTDAANGVIVITTKRGRPGPAQWNVYASTDLRKIPSQQFRNAWWGWSPTIFGSPAYTPFYSCTLEYQAAGYCAQDSVTAFPNRLNDPAYSIFGAKPSWAYGASVVGGQTNLRYTVSAGLTDATGPIQLPQGVIDSLKNARGVRELPSELLNPNTQKNVSLRSGVEATLSRSVGMSVNAGYTQVATRALSYSPSYAGPFLQTRANPNFGAAPPQELFAQSSIDWVSRFNGSVGLSWQPSSWFQGHASVGLDVMNSRRYSLIRPGEAPSAAANGMVGEDRRREIGTGGDLGFTVTVQRGRLSSRTSFGAQYNRGLEDRLEGIGEGLPPNGGSSLSDAMNRSVSQGYSESVSLGSYLEQVVGLNDRLFLSGAIRLDGASGFGRHYKVAGYPKVGLSWLLSEEPFLPRVPGLDELRLRFAFGVSGRQPIENWTQPQYERGEVVYVDGVVGSRLRLRSYGNPDLRPERVREHEFGLDATAFQSRVQFGLTWHGGRAKDAIVSIELPYSFGGAADGGLYTNLGLVDRHGFEAQLSVRALETRLVTWNFTLQHSWQDNTLVDRGGGLGSGWREGYPIGSRFSTPLLGYTDTNGDGMIVRGEVQVGDSAVFVGRSAVPRTQTLSTTVGFFAQRVRLSAMFDRQSGAVAYDYIAAYQCAVGSCRARVDPATPLAEQAQALVALSAPSIQRTDFTALREVSVAFDVPAGLVRALRLRSASVSIAARNVARWTPVTGFDPETEGGRVPLARLWGFHVNAGF